MGFPIADYFLHLSFGELPNPVLRLDRSCPSVLPMVNAVSVRAPFVKQFRMAILKSGFRKAYMSGFTNEPVATVNKETTGRAPGMTSILFIIFAVVMYMIGSQQSRKVEATMEKTLATLASDDIRFRSFLCTLKGFRSFFIVKLRRTCLNIRM